MRAGIPAFEPKVLDCTDWTDCLNRQDAKDAKGFLFYLLGTSLREASPRHADDQVKHYAIQAENKKRLNRPG